MPEGTKVESCYQKLKKEGHSEESAARICQSSTGLSLQTGQPPKKKSLSVPKVKCYKGIREKCTCPNCRKGKAISREQIEKNIADRKKVDEKMPAFRSQVSKMAPQQMIQMYSSMDQASQSERTDIGRYGLNEQMNVLTEEYHKKTKRSIIMDT